MRVRAAPEWGREAAAAAAARRRWVRSGIGSGVSAGSRSTEALSRRDGSSSFWKIPAGPTCSLLSSGAVEEGPASRPRLSPTPCLNRERDTSRLLLVPSRDRTRSGPRADAATGAVRDSREVSLVLDVFVSLKKLTNRRRVDGSGSSRMKVTR
eukprot:g13780.t1